LIGAAVTPCTAAVDTIRRAALFIIVTTSTDAAEQARARDLPATPEDTQAGLVLSTETTAPREGTPRHAVKPERALAPLAATARAVRPEAFHRAGSPASADRAAVVAGLEAVVAGLEAVAAVTVEAAADIDRERLIVN
jgi:hypothetical protein